MDFDEIVRLVNQVVLARKGRPLKTVERIVLKGAWENQTYTDIATTNVGYTEDYLKKDVGPNLWKLLSDVVGENHIKVTKRNIQNVLKDWAIGQEQLSQENAATAAATDLEPLEKTNGSTATSPMSPPWAGSPIDVSEFCGRSHDLTTWIDRLQNDHCCLALVWGAQGVGKTLFTAKLIDEVKAVFTSYYYLPLSVETTPASFFQSLRQWLNPSLENSVNPSPEAELSWVLQQFLEQRCLLVVDNGDVLFDAGYLAGTYRADCGLYQQFLQQVARLQHRSCVIWISREQPSDLAQLEGQRVRSLHLQNLSATDASLMLQPLGPFVATPDDWQALVERYGGSPWLLKNLATTIRDVYRGNLQRFLEARLNVPGPVYQALEQTLQRLTLAERELLYWLALAHTAMTLVELEAAMLEPPVNEVVQSLLGRSLCEVVVEAQPGTTSLLVPPVVREVVIDQMVADLKAELETGQLTWLLRLPLLRTTASEGVQAQQETKVLQPLAAHLREICPTEATLTTKFQQIHQALRSQQLSSPSYGAGNLIHLCQELDISLGGIDFSELAIYQANLQQVSLQGANFAQAAFADTVFTTALGREPVVAFSRDGIYLAIGDLEGRLLLWETQRGRLVRVLDDGGTPPVRSLAFSPEGDLLAVGYDDGPIRLWPLQSAYEPDVLGEHHQAVQALTISDDGLWLASGDGEGEIRLWDLASGVCQQVLNHHQGAINSLRFSPDSQQLLSCSEVQEACLWAIPSGQLIATCDGNLSTWMGAVGFTLRLPKTDEAVGSYQLIPFVAGIGDDCLMIWEIMAGRPCWILPSDLALLPAIAVSPDGRYLACSRHDRAVSIWDVSQRRHHHTLPDSVLPVWRVLFSPDSRFLVTCSDYTVKVWDLQTPQCLRSFWSQRYSVQCLAFAHDSSQLITGHDDSRLRLWQFQPASAFARRLRSLKGHTAPIRAIAPSPDGRWLASSSDDCTIRLWNRENSQDSRVLMDQMSPAVVLTFSPDSQWLISSGEDALVRVWQVASGQCLHGLEGHQGLPAVLAVSPDSQYIVSGSRDRTLRIWILKTGACEQVLTHHQRRIHSLSFSPDGDLFISASSDGIAHWWRMPEGKLLGTWQHPQEQWLHGVTIDPTGQLLALTSDTLSMEIWSITHNQRLHVLTGHTHEIWQVAISPDRCYLATASQDEEIRIWQIQTGSCEQVLRPDRPYEGVNIRGATGLTEPETQMLRSLGAVVNYA